MSQVVQIASFLEQNRENIIKKWQEIQAQKLGMSSSRPSSSQNIKNSLEELIRLIIAAEPDNNTIV